MISKQDILDYINNNYSSVIGNIHIYENEIINELINLCNDVNEAQNKNDNQLISEKYLINSIVKEFINNNFKYNERRDKLYKLLQLDLPEQRSPEWYEMRRDKLTASSIATAMGDDNYKSKYNLIYDKITNAPHISNIHTEWGTKYEEIATLFYQLITKTTVKEFGMIPHPDFPIFGASPDGIVGALKPGAGKELFGRMLEIKVPPKRVIEPGVCPKHYWMQVQGQLEVCDLPDADFLQCKIEEFCIGSHYSCDNFYENGVIIHGYTSDKLEKGCVITYKNKCDPIGCIKYIYSELYQPNHKVIEWRDNECERILNDGGEVIDCKFWKLLIYDVTFVKRDKDFWNKVVPEIINFWSDVLKWRKKGIENLKLHIQYEKEKKKLDNEKMKKEKEDKLMVIKLEKETKRNKEKEEREKIKNEEEQMKAIEKGIKEKERKNKKEKKEKEKLDKKIKKDKERDIKKKTTTENKMTQDEKLKKIQANTIVLNI